MTVWGAGAGVGADCPGLLKAARAKMFGWRSRFWSRHHIDGTWSKASLKFRALAVLREPYQRRGMSMRILLSPGSLRGSEQSYVNRDRALGRGGSPEKRATNTGATGSLVNEMLVVFLNYKR